MSLPVNCKQSQNV